MRNLLYAVLLAVVVAATGPTTWVDAQRGAGDRAATSGTRTVAFPFQGRTRQYVLYVPTAPDCAPTVTSTPLPALGADGTAFVRRPYAGCRGIGDVVWYEIEGGGHRWPPHAYEGAEEGFALRENGVSSRNINASEVIWAFFAGHARR